MNRLNENIASRPGEIMSAPIFFFFFMVINMHLVVTIRNGQQVHNIAGLSFTFFFNVWNISNYF